MRLMLTRYWHWSEVYLQQRLSYAKDSWKKMSTNKPKYSGWKEAVRFRLSMDLVGGCITIVGKSARANPLLHIQHSMPMHLEVTSVLMISTSSTFDRNRLHRGGLKHFFRWSIDEHVQSELTVCLTIGSWILRLFLFASWIQQISIYKAGRPNALALPAPAPTWTRGTVHPAQAHGSGDRAPGRARGPKSLKDMNEWPNILEISANNRWESFQITSKMPNI